MNTDNAIASNNRPERDSFMAYQASMPAQYLEAFSEREMWNHYDVVSSRGKGSIQAGMWREPMSVRALVCVSAVNRDELVGDIAALLESCSLVIESAQIHTRKSATGQDEALDLFWVRSNRLGELLDDNRLDACTCALRALGPMTSPSALKSRSKRVHGGEEDLEVSVRVLCSVPRLFLVKVQAGDRVGLLASVARVLYQEGLSIVSATIETSRDGLALDYFIGRAWRSSSSDNLIKAEVMQRGLQHALSG